MNKYESHLLHKDIKAVKIDDITCDFVVLCHKDITGRRDTKKQYDKLAIAGYKKDLFGNYFRNGR